MPSKVKGASGREYEVHPIEVAWHFSADADIIEDFKNVVLLVGYMAGSDFIPVDVVRCEKSILPYFGQWGSGNHWAREWGATHFATYWANEPDIELVHHDLLAAYPHPSGRKPI